MFKKFTGFLLPLSLSLIVACSEEVIPEVRESPTPSQQQGDPFTTTGTFAARYVISQEVEDVISPARDDFDPQIITTYSVVKLAPGADETHLTYRSDTCIVEMTEVAGSLSTLLDGYYANEPEDVREIILSEARVGATFTLPEQIDLRGVNLEDPANDPLPTDPEDPRVYDYDKDGNPGFTIHVSGAANGDLYTIERFRYVYNGVVVTNDDISGLIAGHPEDVFLVSTNWLISTDTEVLHDTPPEENFFEFKRAEDDLTCDELLSQISLFFP